MFLHNTQKHTPSQLATGNIRRSVLSSGWYSEPAAFNWGILFRFLKGCDGSRPHHEKPGWKVSRCGLYLQDTCGSCSWVGNSAAVHRAKLNTQNLALRLKTSHLRRDVVFATVGCGWNAGWNDVTALARLSVQSQLTTWLYPEFHPSQSFISLAACKGLSDLWPQECYVSLVKTPSFLFSNPARRSITLGVNHSQ